MIRGLRHGSRAKRILTLLMLAAALVLVVDGLAGLLLALQIRGRFTTITRDSVPSILAAQNLRAQAQDMDADLANTVLENDNPGPNKENWAALRATSAKTLLDELGQAQGNITFNGECQTVAALRSAFVDYSGFAAQAEQDSASAKQGGAKVGDASSPQAVIAYQQAANIVLGQIEPAVVLGSTQDGGAAIPANAAVPAAPGQCKPNDTALSQAGGLFTVNNQHEVAAYDSGNSLIGLGIGVMVVLGLLAIALAVLTNLRFARLVHRYANVGLVAAAVLALVILVFSVGEFVSLKSSFKTVSKDALDSIRYALSIRARANAGNADESRWLFDRQQADAWQTDFFAQRDAVNDLINRARANITFNGERTAIDGSETAKAGDGGLSKAWATYQQLDGQIRQAENSKNHLQAIQLNLGPSNDAYAAFLKGVSDLQAVNQKMYADTASSAQSKALFTGVAALIVALAGTAAAVFGSGRRLSEL